MTVMLHAVAGPELHLVFGFDDFFPKRSLRERDVPSPVGFQRHARFLVW